MFNLSYLGSIGLSLLLTALIGWERESQDKPAGLRDVMLVGVGATLFTIISLILREVPTTNGVRYDLGRIIAYSIVGIGFLGSGVIMSNNKRIEGITTAGVLWISVAVGVLVGLQQYSLAIVSALVIWFVLKLKHIRIIITKKTKKR